MKHFVNVKEVKDPRHSDVSTWRRCEEATKVECWLNDFISNFSASASAVNHHGFHPLLKIRHFELVNP